ncbi:sulfatase-like hydrolase/transferase [Phycisphaeraceae bacterium D3-23]
MSRVVFIIALVCLAFSVRAAQPNVVFIISDDQHFGDYGFMGHEHVETPHLDALAQRSLVFRRGYVTTSLCCPSLATMLTGQSPRRHGITGNLPGQNRPEFGAQQQAYIDMMRAAQPLPTVLAQHGYLSFQSGKWWCGSYETGGFTHGMTHGDPARGGRHGDAGLAIGRQGLAPIADFLDHTLAEEQPFFLWYAPFLPHTPHNPPERLFEKYRAMNDSPHVARYWAMCEWFDETCGELLAMLDEKGVADNTLIVYICDNGWINRPDRQGYAPRSKRSPYDGGLRTPIMLCWPGVIEPGERDDIATNLDLLPTALAACGIDIPETIDGVDLLDPAGLRRTSFSGAVYSHDAVDIHTPQANLEYRWRIDGRWKLIVPNAQRFPDRSTELYDIIADPEEENEVSAQHPDVVRAMTADLEVQP